jgi:succinate dehydrogenase / fumarate reductase, cytochrome b subunit
MAAKERPLSPHLQIYKPQISSVLSIAHRASGIALTVGTILLVWWLLAAATGPDAYATAQSFMGSIIGQILIFGWTLAFYFHLCNGIRHLAWDAGFGFDLPVMNMSGKIAVGASVVLTILSWIIAYIVW